MDINKSLKICLLNDFYGNLLTKKQQMVVDSYYNQNISLGELSEILGITRQAVRDSLQKATKMLEKYEENLGFYKKHFELIGKIETLKEKNPALTKQLDNLIEILEVN